MQKKNIGLPVSVVQKAGVEATESDNGQKGQCSDRGMAQCERRQSTFEVV